MNASEFGCGHGHELAKTWVRAGGELADLTTLTQSVEKCQQVIAYLRDEAEIVIKVVKNVADRLLREITKVTLLATPDKKTKDCFLSLQYHYRNAELDRLFAEVQPTGKAGQFTTQEIKKELNFKEVAQAILGVDETSINDLAKALIEKGHTVVLPQIEVLIERTDVGEVTGLRTDGWGNFFFVENKEGGVSVVCMGRRDNGQWFVGVDRFALDRRWRVEFRFFSRNVS